VNQYSQYPYGSNPPGSGSNPYSSYSPPESAPPSSYSAGTDKEPTVRNLGSSSGFNPYEPMTPTPSPPPPVRPSRSLSARVFVVLGLAVLLVLAGILFGAGILYQNAQTSNAHATATAQAARNATAQANSIATAVSSTATASANATATAVASHYPFSDRLVLNDPMYDNSRGNRWYEGSNAYGSCRFTQGAYHISVPTTGPYIYCLAVGSNFSNFTYEVKVTVIRGTYGGIIFRASSNGYYGLLVSADGHYFIFYYDGSRFRTLDFGIITQKVSGFYTGLDQANSIGVVARGSQLDFYANGQHFASETNSLSSSGEIGMTVEAANQPTEVAFSDAKVWVLP
jgi:hypothetical protein